MTKGELIDQVAEAAGMTKKDAGTAVSTVFDSITSALKGGDRIQIVGFGTFTVKKRAARTGVVPGTGEKRTFPARKVVRFKAGKGLSDAVQG